ncbi:Lys48-specific deubiquitinase [Aureococcus anophagefferens]|uniref:Lys48-specific deubiquitinase n=1 Tax=Aureococcus anophagefferens TaxID=44056 RepID=A0ABR1FYN2_AURAN
MEQRFPLKTVMFLGRTVPVLGQNEFGPCALLSVVNALLLQNALELSPDLGSVSLADVVALVGDQILERNSKAAGGDGEAALNTRRAVEEAIALLPTLAGGLDVNVRFAGDSLFEFTGCLGIFDLFDLALVHGWRADPSDPADGGAAHAALGAKSYNEVIARVVEGRAGNDDAEAAAMDDFLSRSATQLTYFGLVELHGRLKERQLAALYRNFHFSTIFKYEGHIYVLVTDVGYQHEASIVWEKLDGVDGDTEFVDGEFRVARPKSTLAPSTRQTDGADADADYLVALQLQQESDESAARALVAPDATSEEKRSQEDADYRAALALQFDDAEDDGALAERPARGEPAPRAAGRRAPAAAARACARARRRRAGPRSGKSSSSCAVS